MKQTVCRPWDFEHGDLRKLRDCLFHTQEEVVGRINDRLYPDCLAVSSYQRWERNKTYPRIKHRKLLREVLGEEKERQEESITYLAAKLKRFCTRKFPKDNGPGFSFIQIVRKRKGVEETCFICL